MLHRLPPHLATLLRRCHRRQVTTLMLEAAGMGAVVGAGLSVVLVLTHLSASPLAAAVFILLGAAVGATVRAGRLPSLQVTAIRADRQLQADDLLATALWAASRPEPWGEAVIGSAEARSRELAAEAVRFNAFGKAAWGGVMLVLAMPLLLQLLLAPDEATSRPASRDSASVVAAIEPDRSAPLLSPVTLRDRHAIAPAEPDEPGDRPPAPDSDSSPHRSSASAYAAQPHQPAEAGSGSALARDQTATSPAQVHSPLDTASSHQQPGTLAASGDGVASPTRLPNLAQAGPGVVAPGAAAPDGNSTKIASPPDGRAGHDDRSAAASLPPAYSQLIRDYFAR